MDVASNVATIVQLVDFSITVLSRIKDYIDSGTDAPKVYRDIAYQLPLHKEDLIWLKQSLKNRPANSTGMEDAIRGYHAKLVSLDKLLVKVLPPATASKSRRIIAATYSLTRDKKVDSVWKSIQEYRITLIPHITASLKPSTNDENSPSLFDIPPLHTPNFVPRPHLMGRITKLFDDGRSGSKPSNSLSTIVVLLGMGGQGKTQLALDFCRNAKNDDIKAIFWIDSSSRNAAMNGIKRVAKRLFPSRDFDDKNDAAVDCVRETLSGWSDVWVLVFDNYDDPPGFLDISKLFPQSSKGCILVTSRHHASKRLGKTVEVTEMETEEGLQLLLGSNDVTEADRLDAMPILSLLGCLPLALDQAHAYITARQIPIASFKTHYEGRKLQILKETPQLSVYRRKLSAAEDETTLSVFVTWEMSLSQLCTISSNGSQLISFLSMLTFFHPAGIAESYFTYPVEQQNKGVSPASLFFTGNKWDHFQFEEAVVHLQNLSLIHFSRPLPDEILISLHPLVSEWLRLRCEVSILDTCIYHAHKHFSLYLENLNKDSIEFHQQQDILHQLDALLRHAAIHHDQCSWEILVTFGKFYRFSGDLDQAAKLLSKSYQVCEEALGPEHTSTLYTVNNLGLLYSDQGRMEEAGKLYERALAGYEKALGADHTSTLDTVHNIGKLYCDQGRFEEAEKLFERALVGKEKALGSDHTSTLDTVNSLGFLYNYKGRLEEAEKLHERVLAGYEKVFGPDHTSTLSTVNSLGILYSAQGRSDEAKKMFERSMAGYEKALCSDHITAPVAVHNLQTLYCVEGRLEEAEKVYEQALAVYKNALGPDHRYTLGILANLKQLYYDNSKPEEAEKLSKVNERNPECGSTSG